MAFFFLALVFRRFCGSFEVGLCAFNFEAVVFVFVIVEEPVMCFVPVLLIVDCYAAAAITLPMASLGLTLYPTEFQHRVAHL